MQERAARAAGLLLSSDPSRHQRAQNVIPAATPSPYPVTKKTADEMEEGSLRRLQVGAASLAVALLAMTSANQLGQNQLVVSLPRLGVWVEVALAFGGGCVLGWALALLVGHAHEYPSPSSRVAVAFFSSLLLALPFIAPFEFGIAASALALSNFIAVWKAADVLGGTCPAAVVSNGPAAFRAFFMSPVEYVRSGSAVVPASHRLWLKQLASAGCSFAALALTVSVRIGLDKSHFEFPRAQRAAVLYAEVRMHCAAQSTHAHLCSVPRAVSRPSTSGAKSCSRGHCRLRCGQSSSSSLCSQTRSPPCWPSAGSRRKSCSARRCSPRHQFRSSGRAVGTC